MPTESIPLGFGEHFPHSPFCSETPIVSQDAWQKCGLHPAYIKGICDTANLFNVLILIRGMDRNYTLLLNDQYSTKSMRIHAKTCNWGPMTGFVCFSPNLHKKSLMDTTDAEQQSKAILQSLAHPTYPLKHLTLLRITDSRRKELESIGKIKFVSQNHGHYIYRAMPESKVGLATEPENLFCLVHSGTYSIHGEVLFYVFSDAVFDLDAICVEHMRQIDKLKNRGATDLIRTNMSQLRENVLALSREMQWPSVHGMNGILVLVDPHTIYPARDYRTATTGDYDLFSIHPLLAHYASEIYAVKFKQASILRTPANMKFYRHAIRIPEHHGVRLERIAKPVPNGLVLKTLYHDIRSLGTRTPDSTPHSPVTQRVSRVDMPSGLTTSGSSSVGSSIEYERGSRSIPGESIVRASTYPDDVRRVRTPEKPSRSHSSDEDFRPQTEVPEIYTALQGHLTQREMEIIMFMNERVQYGTQGRLFHHGPESHHPEDTKQADFPCIAIIPCVLHSSEAGAGCFRAVWIENSSDLEQFYLWNVIFAGYALTPGFNLNWFLDPNFDSSSSLSKHSFRFQHPFIYNAVLEYCRFEWQLLNS